MQIWWWTEVYFIVGTGLNPFCSPVLGALSRSEKWFGLVFMEIIAQEMGINRLGTRGSLHPGLTRLVWRELPNRKPDTLSSDLCRARETACLPFTRGAVHPEPLEFLWGIAGALQTSTLLVSDLGSRQMDTPYSLSDSPVLGTETTGCPAPAQPWIGFVFHGAQSLNSLSVKIKEKLFWCFLRFGGFFLPKFTFLISPIVPLDS